MLSVLCWSWAGKFEPVYINRLRAALAIHLHLDHEVVCVTDNPDGIDSDIRTLPITELTDTPRCRRRMKQYDPDFARDIGDRILSIDLDVVIVDDLTPIVDRPEPIVCWKVGYASVYSGSFVLYDSDALHGLWERFKADPDGYPKTAWPTGVGSDQAMLNHYLKSQRPIPHWTERDGFVTYFGAGYERKAHHGMGPTQPALPAGARIVVLGSADKAVMDEGAYPWVRQHWTALEAHA
jgi:uncharacterized protein YbdZ (MbtH family)